MVALVPVWEGVVPLAGLHDDCSMCRTFLRSPLAGLLALVSRLYLGPAEATLQPHV